MMKMVIDYKVINCRSSRQKRRQFNLLYTEEWLKKQGERHGFTLLTDDNGLCKLQNSAYVWHGLNSKGKKAGFSSVNFSGQLQITDVDKFERALFYGIGRSKAFGCGLLMVRRI